MCNKYRLKGGAKAVRARKADLDQLQLPLRLPEVEPNYQPADYLYPKRDGLVLRLVDGGLEPAVMRWGLVPFFHKGPLSALKGACNNARAETVETNGMFKHAFARRRCLIPADSFHEWTGEKGAKREWSIARADGRLLLFAGLWEHAETADGPIDSYTMITGEPGLDAANYHDRQPVLLRPEACSAWLDPATPMAAFLEPWPAGTLVGVDAAEAA